MLSTLLTNFDEPKGAPSLLHDWKTSGGVELDFKEAPAGNSASGLALHMRGPKDGFVYASLQKLPVELVKCESLTFDLYRPANAPALTLQAHFIEPASKARFWRRIDLKGPSDGGWQRIEVPLRYMRWSNESDTRYPQWQNVRYIGFRLCEAGEVYFDNIALQHETGIGAHISTEELAELAFPNSPLDQLKRLQMPNLRLLSDAPELDVDALQVKMSELHKMLASDLWFLPEPDSPPTLLIFATRQQYLAFVPRLAHKLNSGSPQFDSGGFTLQSIGTSFWDWHKDFGPLRPVYFHEYVHSYLGRTALLPDNSNWLQEGIANFYQNELFPQENLPNTKDLRDIIIEGLDDQNKRDPLIKLASGKGINGNQYWQVLTLVRFLMESRKYGTRWEQLFKAFAKNGSTDLRPLLRDVLKVSPEQFEREWMEFTRNYYTAHRTIN